LLATAKAFRAGHNDQPMSPRALSEAIVRNYVEHYSDYDRSAGRSVDLAAIDLTKVEGLDDAMANLAESLRDADPNRVLLAHWRAQTYKADQFVDLHDFCIQAYKQFEGDARVREACVKVIQILDGDTLAIDAVNANAKHLTTNGGGCIIKSGCSGFAHQHSYGLTVYFPWAYVSADYRFLSFGKNQEWYKFLHKHVTATRRESRFEEEAGVQRPQADVEALKRLFMATSQRGRVRASVDALVEEVGNSDIAPEDVVTEFDRSLLRRIGVRRRSRYTGDIDRYTGDIDRYPGEPSRSSFDRQKCVKNLAIPGIGTAYWPPDPAKPQPEEPQAKEALASA
jgi:hypothetical protein